MPANEQRSNTPLPVRAARRRADESFDAVTAELVVRRTRVAALIGITIFPAFWILDWLAYPEHAWTFLGYRLGSSAVMVAVWAAARLPLVRARLVPAYAAYLSVGLAITAMVYATGGPTSPYYVGLCLVALSTVLVMPWPTRHTAQACALLYAAYALPPLFLGHRPGLAALAVPHFFLLTSGVLATIGTHLAYRNRREQFDLTWKLDRQAQELSRVNEQLRELDAAKARFFANASHELRTPLTLMLGPLESALERPLPDDLRDELRMFQVAAQRLSGLINDLLDIAEIDSGGRRLRKAPVRLADVVREVVMAARPFAHKHEITIAAGIPDGLPAALLDRPAVEQVVYNLVCNALKFTPRRGRVEVSVAEDLGGALVMTVADDGPGVPPERMATLFDRFSHHTETVHAKGSGLGLSLVKEHVDAHGGTVTVESAQGRGTRFTVRLPLGAPRSDMLAEAGLLGPVDRSLTSQRRALNFTTALAERPAPGEHTFTTSPVRPAQRGGPKVLVVDDDPEMRALVVRCLAGDFAVIEAADGCEGLTAFDQLDPDVIVSDIGMPVLDGIEMCRSLRRRPGGAGVPVLFLTARAGDDPRLQGLESGANDYLTKPFSKRELRARVRNAVALRGAERQLAQALDAEREAREQLVRSEKLAELGKMAVEVGHEINNPLNFMLNYAKRLKLDSESLLASTGTTPPPDRLVRFPDILERVVDGGERIQRIVHGLRALAARPDREVRVVDVDREVDSTVKLFEAGLPPGVTVARRGLCKDGLVQAPVTAIGQVLTNLLSNAVKAVEGRVGPQEIEVRTGHSESGDAVIIRVKDAGCGMTAEVAARVYDAFFTTRTSGQGLGVGMAVTHRLVTEDMKGAIELDTAPGVGTEFRVALPLAASAASEQAAAA